METRNTALITGASSGIGVAFARQLAALGHDLILTARRKDRLEKLANELETEHGITVRVLPADLADPAAPQMIFEQTMAWNMRVDTLINNAGFGVYDKFTNIDDGQNFSMIQVMVSSLTELTRLFVNPMLKRGDGAILNVASIGAELPAPGLSVYAGTKSYVVHFTESLNMELDGTGVTASVLLPGATRTEWFDVANFKAGPMLESFTMDADAVASEGLRALRKGTPKRIAGLMNRVQVGMMRFMPRPVLNRLMSLYIA